MTPTKADIAAVYLTALAQTNGNKVRARVLLEAWLAGCARCLPPKANRTKGD